jgi:hypothetical protein
MSDSRLQLNEFDIEFLNVLCAEEVMRCKMEQRNVRHVAQVAVSKQREKTAMKLLEAFTDTLERIDEDDGMESRPELN